MAFAGGGIWWWQTAGGAPPPPPAPAPAAERRGGHRIPGESLAEYRDLTRDAILARQKREARQTQSIERKLRRQAAILRSDAPEAEQTAARETIKALLAKWQQRSGIIDAALGHLEAEIAAFIQAEIARLKFEAEEDEALSLLLLME